MRAVIDNSVWVSAAISPNGFCSPLVDHLAAQRFVAVACAATQRELSVVLHRPVLVQKYGLTDAGIVHVMRALLEFAEHVPDPPSIDRVSRDPRDDIFIAAAATSKADCLVSRDDDLKRDPAVLAYLEPIGVRVMSVREFLAALE